MLCVITEGKVTRFIVVEHESNPELDEIHLAIHGEDEPVSKGVFVFLPLQEFLAISNQIYHHWKRNREE